MHSQLLCAFMMVSLIGGSFGAPQYFHEVVRQAHSLNLLPQYSVVDKTAPGIQVANYYIGPHERADLRGALGGSIPFDVLKSLEQQVDAIGRYHYH